MPVAIKICGLTTTDAITAVNAAQVEYAGFVYYPASPRHLPLEKAAQLKTALSPAIKTVSVVVNPDDALLADIMAILTPDYLQLHDKDSPERIRHIRAKYPTLKIIKAIPVRTSNDIARAMPFSDLADIFLFDAKPPSSCGPRSGSTGSHAIDRDPAQPLRGSQDDEKKYLPGGNGLSFDWNLLSGRSFSKPWMLSGGLNSENIQEAIRLSGAQAVDVSSSVESAPGVKNQQLIEKFVKAVRG